MDFEEYSKRFRKHLEGNLKYGKQIEVSDEELLKLYISCVVFGEFQIEELKRAEESER